MEYGLLALTALALACQDIFKKQFNKKNNRGTFLFAAMIGLCATLFFVGVNIFVDKDWFYRPLLLLPSGGFAISYAAATLFSVLAIRNGSLAKTSLVVVCSLLPASAYGIIWGGDKITPALIIGTILLLAALILVNYEKKDSDQPITLKWVIYVTLAFLGNAMCNLAQRIKQDLLGNDGNNMFMIVALAMVTVIMFVFAIISKDERPYLGDIAKKGWLYALICGGANGLVNFLVILLNKMELPASVMFPVISGGSMVLIFLYSVFVVREKFKLRQIIGFFLGVVSIVLLNL